MSYPRFVKYFPAFVCAKCDRAIGRVAMMYSNGVCPLCGNASDSTVVDCYKRVYKKIERRPWWQFWNGLRYEYEIVSEDKGEKS